MNVLNLNAAKPIVNDDRFNMAKDGLMKSETVFIHNLIREHAKHQNDGYVLYAKDLPLHDQKILLSYEVSAVNYEDALSSPTLTKEYISDYLDSMQAAIDKELDSVYQEDMEEMGLCLSQRSNGDVLWIRR